MNKTLPVSLVIPVGACTAGAIDHLFRAIRDQTAWPKEIILVTSLNREDGSLCEILSSRFDRSITIRVIPKKNAYPGKARNIGVSNATHEFIAFLDLMTIPHSTWLDDFYQLLVREKYDGVIGKHCFIGKTFFSWVLIDGLFGRQPTKTLPGSIFTRRALDRIGPMAEKIRSGEDNEWFQRAQLFEININKHHHFIAGEYFGYSNIKIADFLLKWVRNYRNAADLPQYTHLATLNFILWMLIILSVALNWNSFFAEWETTHPLYIPHITKIVTLSAIGLYILLRAIYLPISRGSPPSQIIGFRLVFIIFIVVVADTIKSLCFLTSFFRNIPWQGFSKIK